MAEQIPNDFNNNQDNNQQNLVVQMPEEKKVKMTKNLVCGLVFVCCIYGSEILWNVFIWFASFLDSIVSYNYKTHSRDVDEKYYSNVKIFTIPCLVLSYIILGVGSANRCHPKITVIINIVLLLIKIPVFILYCKNLFKIFSSDSCIPKISIGLECAFVVAVLVYELLKYMYLYKNK